jgi:phosphatidylglycerol:prolipoprotein diacylglycerol transferase
MWTFPNIDPVILHIYGPIAIRWYGLMYVIGFICGYVLLLRRAKEGRLALTQAQIQSFIFYAVLGVLVGGRLGYVVFYQLDSLVGDPLRVFAVWEGGMSFHGGLIGILLACVLFVRKYPVKLLELADAMVLAGVLGLFFGRVGNFINGELYGRVTESPLGMVFPQGGPLPRHPSQLYEAVAEGLLGFALLWWLRNRLRPGQLLFVSILYYGAVRFGIEFFREPDTHIGFYFGWMTLGQILCLGMVGVGLGGLLALRSKKDTP